jgi:DNA-binding transcriptional LysR family regulator
MQNNIQQFYYKNNRVHQLKGFYYTAQEGTITKAAKRTGLTTATISLQIKTLERDIGCQLFLRKKDKMELTEDGEALYKLASPILQQFDSVFERFIENKTKFKDKVINIAIHHIAISYLLPKYLEIYEKNHEDVKIIIHNLPRKDAFERLQRDELDFLIYPINEKKEEFNFQTIQTYDPLLIMHKDHPLTKIPEEAITLSEIAKYKLIRIESKQIILPMFEEAVKYYKIGSNITFENGDWQMLKHFVQNKIGIALISTICYNPIEDKNIVGKKLSKFFPGMEYCIVTKKNAFINDIVKDFISLFVEKTK